MSYIGTMIFLFVSSFSDLKKRTINTYLCIAIGIMGIATNILWGNLPKADLIFGMALGMIFLGISVLTKERLGFGDGFVILTLGMCLGGIQCFRIVLWAFILCALTGMGGILFLKMEAVKRLPFVPFLAVASVIQFVSR